MRRAVERASVWTVVLGGAALLYSCHLLLGGSPAPLSPTLPLGRSSEVNGFSGAFAGTAVPGEDWSLGDHASGYLLQPFVSAMENPTTVPPEKFPPSTRTPELFGGVLTASKRVWVHGVGDGTDQDPILGDARLLVVGRVEGGERTPPEPFTAVADCYSLEPLAVTTDGDVTSWFHRWTDGRAELSDDRSQVRLMPGTYFSAEPGEPEEDWAELQLTQVSEQVPAPNPLPLLSGGTPPVARPYWQRDFFGDWQAELDGSFCTPGGECVELDGDLYVRIQVVPGLLSVPSGQRGTFVGWGFYRGKIDGRSSWLDVVLAGAPVAERRARALLGIRVSPDAIESGLLSQVIELEVTPDSASLRAWMLDQETELEHLPDNQPPALAFQAPALGAEVPVGEPVTLEVAFNDAEDRASTEGQAPGGMTIVAVPDPQGALILPGPDRVEWLDADTLEPLGASPATVAGSTVLRATWTPRSTGTKHVLCRVRDLGGKVSLAATSVDVLGQAPNEPVIVHPRAGVPGLLTAPGEVLLEGCAYDVDDGELAGEALAWESDLDGSLGTGKVLEAEFTTPGLHTLTLTATDSEGRSASTTREVSLSAWDGVPLPQVRVSQPPRVYCVLDLFVHKGDKVAFGAQSFGLGPFGTASLTWHLQVLPTSGPPGTRMEVGTGANLVLQVPDDGAATATRYRLSVTVQGQPGKQHTSSLVFWARPKGATVE